MAVVYILIALVLFSCIVADKFSGRFGMPALILFMCVGMLFGCDGIAKIQFDNYELAEKVCAVALSFIMFYGGFNTKWKTAKAVASRAVILSTAGVVITSGLTSVFCYYVLNFGLTESFLIGAVLSSTDAASVFSILRKKKLNLREGTAPLLEIESGSNDPISYLLTVIGITLVNSGGMENITYMVFTQILFGVLIGVIVAIMGVIVFTKTNIIPDGLDTIFMIGLVLIAFGLSEIMGGNAFLSVYLLGIIIGNSKIRNKKIMIPFFDGVTGLAQILTFFLLGLLAYPHRMPQIILPALVIALFITLVARPIAVFLLMTPFGCSVKQSLLVSWAGLRGAASIVFSIMVVAGGGDVSFDIFHIVFMVALFSVTIQGTLIPKVAEKLGMVDNDSDVRKTFNDYQEEASLTLMRMYIPKGHNWENKRISGVSIPTGSLALMIKRDGETIIPNGDTEILSEDSVILRVPSYESGEKENLKELLIDNNHRWKNKTIQELKLPGNVLIALIKRQDENLIPSGNTIILEGDIVVLYK